MYEGLRRQSYARKIEDHLPSAFQSRPDLLFSNLSRCIFVLGKLCRQVFDPEQWGWNDKFRILLGPDRLAPVGVDWTGD